MCFLQVLCDLFTWFGNECISVMPHMYVCVVKTFVFNYTYTNVRCAGVDYNISEHDYLYR